MVFFFLFYEQLVTLFIFSSKPFYIVYCLGQRINSSRGAAMVFFSELIHKHVIDSEEKVIGTLCDLIFHDGIEYAPITHLVFLAKDNYKKRLSWGFVKGIRQKSEKNGAELSIILNVPSAELDLTFIHEYDLLAHEILDKQIIDVSGVKVVRVNDILLNKVEDQFCITGVCVGSTSFFRRLGIKNLLSKVIYPLTSEKIIPWKSVEPLEMNKHLALKESKYKVAEMHPGDIADLMEELSPKEQILVFNRLDKKTAAKTLVEAQPEIQESFFRGLKMNRIVELLESMPPHSAADLLAILDEEKRALIVQHIAPEKAEKILELLKYPENTAGSLMRTDVFALSDQETAKQAMTHIRKTRPSADKTHILLVVDKEQHLVGTLSLRALLHASPRQKLRDFMKKHPFAVRLYTSKEDVATALEKYSYFVIPVVDDLGKLHGIITADEVLSVVIPESWIRRKIIVKRVRKKK